ncbi:hypothetical protein B2J88_20310 [Rhodococcus sp. SRB_17]|uniref:hypothetical protein n=1 Tax=Acidovorax sp. SRB_24 TaxID=1962700 RepID=UPI00145F8580|nr:hypothetical protein [Acidovorax sp. SRB_24]NMM75395.1 hypothetical protein [Acidovorax sp. SRB_24]NMM86682.1 hypothetical protein [Rhodococcus sp. SRB_17]
MASVDLLFSQLPATGQPVALVFGLTDTSLPATVNAHLEGVLPPPTLAGVLLGIPDTLASIAAVLPPPKLTGRIDVRQAYVVTLASVLPQPALVADFAAAYLSNTERPTVGQSRAPWTPSDSLESGIQHRAQDTDATPAGTAPRWQPAQPVPAYTEGIIGTTARTPIGTSAAHQSALRSLASAYALYEDAQRSIRAVLHEAFANAEKAQTPLLRQRHQDGLPDRRPLRTTRWQVAKPEAPKGITSRQGPAQWLNKGFGARHENAMRPPAGQWSRIPVLPEIDPCYLPDPHLLFDALWSSDTGLVFICERHGPGPQPEPESGVVVPLQRVYIVLNNITLHRVDTGAELRAHSFGMSLDYQSWTWSWQASLHHDAADYLGRVNHGDPAELAIMVNGQQFRLRMERITRDRRFNPTRWGVSGRGKASILSGPYAPAMPFGNPSAARTAQQLMADVLTVNGVGIGWAVDWHLQDWLVPAGAWAMQGSYIDAINDIAAAAGGYVQPHPTDSVLRILPRYPAAPWDWGSISPDFEIPADAAEVEGTEYIDQPAYNRVFVGGVGAGVFGPFTRAGTAGDVIAPQVTHALITDAVVHRQRGVAELSNTGRQQHVTLNMQVLPETGVIVPGKFVRYLGDRPVMGIVRSTSIDWSFPKLRQTIKLETHA